MLTLQVIKDSDWADAETIDAKEKKMIFKVKEHRKYNAENYWTKSKNHKEKRKERNLFCPSRHVLHEPSFKRLSYDYRSIRAASCRSWPTTIFWKA